MVPGVPGDGDGYVGGRCITRGTALRCVDT